MTWKRVVLNRVQPASGSYGDWKEQIARDCHHQCVYCTIHETEFGGVANFQIDHYRPRSRFTDLTDRIINLFYSCGICNRFKSDYWGDEPDVAGTVAAIPDPATHDHGIHFRVLQGQWLVEGTTVSGIFTVERLYLNRPQLITQRRRRAITANMSSLSTALEAAFESLRVRAGDAVAQGLMTELTAALIQVERAGRALDAFRPYSVSDIARPPAAVSTSRTTRRRRVVAKKPSTKPAKRSKRQVPTVRQPRRRKR